MSNVTFRSESEFHPPAYVYDVIGSVMCFLFVFALVENFVVLTAFIKYKKLRTKTNTWIIALIICDLLIVLNAFPLLIIASFAKDYILGRPGCKWDGFIVTVLGTSSIYLLTGLSIHRYFIMFRNHRSTNSSKYKVLVAITACFLFGVLWGILPLVGWGSFELEGIGISCAPNWRSHDFNDISYTASMYTLVLLVPLLVIGYCYTKIIHKVWREKQQASTWIKQRRVMKEIRVTVSVALIILSFLISWMPYAIISACESFFGTDFNNKSPFIVQFPCLMAKTACIWNPIVYVARNKSFRNAAISQLPCFAKRSGSTRNSDVTDNNPLENMNLMLHYKRTENENEVSHKVVQCNVKEMNLA